MSIDIDVHSKFDKMQMFTTLFVKKTCSGGYVHMLKH